VRVPTSELVAELGAFLDTEVPGAGIRETILGHVVRGGNPSALDRLIAQRLAVGALFGLEDGAHDVMLAWDAAEVGQATRDPSVRRIPLAEVLAETGRMLDGTSRATRARVELLTQAESLLAL
jgi:6-phosphofructokinase 1